MAPSQETLLRQLTGLADSAYQRSKRAVAAPQHAGSVTTQSNTSICSNSHSLTAVLSVPTLWQQRLFKRTMVAAASQHLSDPPSPSSEQNSLMGQKPRRMSQQGSMISYIQTYKIAFILLYYGFCSSTLIVINKVAVHTLKAPVFILILQLAFSAVTVKSLNIFRVLDAEKLQWRFVRPFLPIVMGFLGTLFSNIKVLSYSNVETFITFRSASPLVLSILDYLFLGRELPSGRSILSIALLIVSCGGYTYYDQGFKLEAYTWLCFWFCFFCFDACYIKHVCDTVEMTNWGRAYYTNFLSSIALAVIFPFMSHEHELIKAFPFGAGETFLLFLSCAVGVGMSHSSFLLRANVSATAGVVVGVVCKILSVMINLLIWDQHATPVQLIFLAVGLVGGTIYKQAPMRAAGFLPLVTHDTCRHHHQGSDYKAGAAAK